MSDIASVRVNQPISEAGIDSLDQALPKPDGRTFAIRFRFLYAARLGKTQGVEIKIKHKKT